MHGSRKVPKSNAICANRLLDVDVVVVVVAVVVGLRCLSPDRMKIILTKATIQITRPASELCRSLVGEERERERDKQKENGLAK